MCVCHRETAPAQSGCGRGGLPTPPPSCTVGSLLFPAGYATVAPKPPPTISTVVLPAWPEAARRRRATHCPRALSFRLAHPLLSPSPLLQRPPPPRPWSLARCFLSARRCCRGWQQSRVGFSLPPGCAPGVTLLSLTPPSPSVALHVPAVDASQAVFHGPRAARVWTRTASMWPRQSPLPPATASHPPVAPRRAASTRCLAVALTRRPPPPTMQSAHDATTSDSRSCGRCGPCGLLSLSSSCMH